MTGVQTCALPIYVGTYQFARGPVMLSDSPEIETNPAPALGQHTMNILSEVLQYSNEKIDKLAESGTIGIN